ncbi:MAG: glycosyltransferase family 2 protein [Methanobrevibacter sp.]|uniref:glycosyltransferase family 2 protein n=1 Tax=Methanobrevibacter sp. TaxID=66852 RepID=UPI0025FC3FE2|nr:glycosyltransferase family 2 protein [Methanobrevibacter sp.]MBQ6100218.1 glycosyltransferase family 2 protein [Methanobrevibacter sp.]
MTKISVIMPVFNEEKYVANAIESVLNQTCDDFELIIVNDGSTDGTLNVIRDFDDDRIRLINQENLGPGASRNRALDIACGEYVMFLDGDDFFREDALMTAYSEAKQKDTDISIFQIIKYNNDEYSKNDWFNLNRFDEEFEDNVFTHLDCKEFLFDISVSACQKIFKREFIERISARFPEGIFFEDMPFFFYTFLNAERISIIRRHLYIRRKHSGSITETVDEKFLDTVEAGRIMMGIFIETGWYDTYKYDLLAFKINGPRYALMAIEEKCKEKLYLLIKKDYEAIRLTEYYQDYLDNLGPVKRKFFEDILKSENYEDFVNLS